MDYDDKFVITPEMKEQLKELKAKIEKEYGPEEAEDGQIFRFLRARNFNLVQGENMLRKHIEWKREKNIYNMAEEYVPNEVQTNYYSFCFIGYSKTGHPVSFFDIGHCDYKGLLKSVKKLDLFKGLLKTIVSWEEALLEQSKKLGKRLEKWIIIFDCYDTHLSHFLYKPTVDFAMELFHLYDANYPERLKTCYCINASPIFHTIFNIIKPFLTSNTLEKVKLFGKDGWKEELLRVIHEKDLPAFLGGTRTDPDGNPLCLETMKFTSPIPKHYYFRSPERRIKNKPNTTKYVLKKSETVDIPVYINEDHSKIEWEFETETSDIAFGLFFKGKLDSQELTTLLETHRVDSDMYIEDGSYSCTKCGTYILTLDNSYSWFQEKQIFLRASIVKPNGEKNFITK